MRRFIPFVLSAAILTACQDTPEPLAPVPDAPSRSAASGEVVSGQYIVVFKNDVADVPGLARQLTAAHGGGLQFVYEHALKGFSARISAQAALALQRHLSVAYVEQDRVHQIAAQGTPTGIRRIFADGNSAIDIDDTDDNRVDVDVAIIDTGIDFQHPDLNVVGGVNCSGGSPLRGSCTSGGDDDHYHGTHVAGTVAALDNGIGVVGVAPGARLHAVKVLNSQGSGYTSWIVAGIDWVANNAGTIDVANMSLGGSGFSQAEYDAIQGAVNNGVAFAVAAGNSDADANNYSPAAFDNVLSVSALADFNGLAGGGATPTCRVVDQDDTLADFSNWGTAVDIAAPGVCILSTYPIERGEYGTISGTSMASPHVAGALALLASKSKPRNATGVYDLYSQVVNAGNYNWTDDSGDGTKERLLDVSDTALFAPTLVATGNGAGGGGSTGPVASFTYACSGLTCNFDGSGSTGATAYTWDFGDNTSGSGVTTSHSYPQSNASYAVKLTVDDSDSSTSSSSTTQTISCSKKGKNWKCQ